MELFEVCVAVKAFSSVPIGLLRLAAYRVVDVSRKGWWTGEIDSLLVRAISNLGCLLHQTFDFEDSKALFPPLRRLAGQESLNFPNFP